MEAFLLDPVFFERHYNCSFFDVGTVPVEQRKHWVIGAGFLVAYAIFMVSFKKEDLLDEIGFPKF
jgi:hypothetical protein